MAEALFQEIGTGFRRARPADARELVTIINAASVGDDGISGWTDESAIWEGDRTSEAEIAALLAAPLATFVLRVQLGQIVGCAYLRKNGDLAYMGMLAVRPSLQGLGVGKRIIAECERIAREEMECKVMTIGVATNHRPDVTAFYERRGYARTGRIKPFEGSQARRVKKAPDLRAEWMEKQLPHHSTY